MTADSVYKNLIRKVLKEGKQKGDRTGTGTLSLFGEQVRYDVSDFKLPLLTTKFVSFKHNVVELLWYLKGGDNTRFLKEHNVNIWDNWADNDGNLGPIYGYQWRNWGGQGIDQIKDLVKQLKENPDSRRHFISAWNVSDLEEMRLPPCHHSFQFYVLDGEISCMVNMRSNDLALGHPYNIACYSLLTFILAQLLDLKPKELVMSLGDTHIYTNHIDELRIQLSRSEIQCERKVRILPFTDIDDLTVDHFSIEDYRHQGVIRFPVAV